MMWRLLTERDISEPEHGFIKIGVAFDVIRPARWREAMMTASQKKDTAAED